VDCDFNPPKNTATGRPAKGRKLSGILLLVAVLLVPVLLLSRQTVSTIEARTEPTHDPASPTIPDIHKEIIDGTISAGDSITTLLGEHLSQLDIHNLDLKSRDIFPLSKICVGQPYKLTTLNGAFESFEYDINSDEQFIIRREEDDFAVSRVPIDYVVHTEKIRGTITSSLFEAVADIGEGADLAVALSDIFAWDVDFIRDIREGDSFQAVLEKRFRDGKPAGYGRILAAEFINQGDRYQAFLFQDGNQNPSYYDAEGKSVRKAFLKAPLSFTRISSGFTTRRLHPITKTYKAHPAIDYAAPIGTPIKSVGDGTVVQATYNKYNGNFVRIRHNSTYETLYNHMSKFGRGIRSGKKVTQGQIIGYVGSTGLSTGPHLDFRMYKNGSPVNPYKIKTPASAPVSTANMESFRLAIAPKLALFENREVLQARTVQPSEAEASPDTGKN